MIHPSALIDDRARLGNDVRVEAFASVGPDVELGDGCSVGAYALVEGPTRIGPGTRIGPHAVVGTRPQDVGYHDEPTRLEMGARNDIREFATLHRASTKQEWVTRVGDDNLFMAYSHVGHDCVVGSHVVLANGATLAGHVTVEDHVNIAGLCAIHQFARIGEYAMLGGGTMVPMDIPPYTMASGNHARLFGLNRRALKRAGIDPGAIRQVRQAYRTLFQSGLRLEAALGQIEGDGGLDAPQVRHLVAFIRATQRGITR